MGEREFGHIGQIIPGFGCFDTWGVGPFVISAAGKPYRFEDSDRFGPSLINLSGDPLANPWPGERSPFWRAHRIWVRQGRRLAADGILCIWDEPKPTTFYRIGGRNAMVVEDGEEDGEMVEVPRPAPLPAPAGSKAT